MIKDNVTLMFTQITSLAAGITLQQVQSILGIVMLTLSIFIGIINLILLLKKVLSDGKIDEKEQHEITDALTNLITEINKIKETKKDDQHDK